MTWFSVLALASALVGCADSRNADGRAAASAVSGAAAKNRNGSALDALLTADGRLRFPADYREWVFLSAGHGMSYSSRAQSEAELPFDNVFVDPASYREFTRSGRWREGTVFVLEVRPSRSHGSINRSGSFQAGEPIAIEVHAKSKRFATGWAFFAAEQRAAVKPLATSAECHSCHRANGAVDTTFVQFYPTLLPVAHREQTLQPSYVEAAERGRGN